MIGPSGFFIPNFSEGAHKHSDNLELIHTSKDGFSELYRGCKNGRFFVYKALKKEYRGNPLYEELLKKDFNIGFSLNHPGICQYYGIVDYPSLGNCIIMDWIDGQTLENLIHVGRIDSRLTKKIICEICDALEYIHRKQIIHRDLKPENIMITNNGHNVKIIDFGLSDTDSYNILKAPAGTRLYASPELIAGEGVDCRTDIWSLGLIISELTPRYSSISSKCTHRDIVKRYASANEVHKAILKEPARKFRNFAAGVLAIGVLASIAFMLSHKGSEIDENDTAPEIGVIAAAESQTGQEIGRPDSTTAEPSAPTPSKKPASKPSSDSTDESLDADALDNMFKNASDLIL